MPWKETCAMDQRIQFIGDWLSGRYTKSELCEFYNISRPTGDKWIDRYKRFGIDGLKEGSRAAKRHPNAVAQDLCARIMHYKLRHPKWGPKKVMDGLRREAPEVAWPADSTAGEILKRAGLVSARRHRRRVPPHGVPLAHCEGANAVWSADFKGDFALGDGQRCYPLTITDNFSRYLLQCRGLVHPTHEATQPWFEWVFREYGLPAAIRTDNGAPFASRAAGGLSRLSAWWVRLGIRPERTEPGRPDQNGRHERMHRTLKEAVVVPPAATLADQQGRFNAFVAEYNAERSHEALDRRTPAECYAASPRPYPVKLAPVEYDGAATVRRVRHNGEIKWKGRLVYVTEVLVGEPVGLFPLDEEAWEVRYSFHPLGVFNERTLDIRSPGPWHGKGENL
jgi:transposase InsO family protein